LRGPNTDPVPGEPSFEELADTYFKTAPPELSSSVEGRTFRLPKEMLPVITEADRETGLVRRIPVEQKPGPVVPISVRHSSHTDYIQTA
jgi:hypothetical protein